MQTEQISAILEKLPQQPGCYQFIGADNKILYIGKARSLKDRVRQYFVNSSDNRFFISRLPEVLEEIRIIITATEKEALILEAELIRRHRPPFNVDLKDDKRYWSLRLDLQAEYPRLELVRKTADDGACYYGPFASASALKSTVRLIKSQFRLRTCSDRQLEHRHNKWLERPRTTRPCLQYELKRCLGPCCDKCGAEEYRQAVANVKQLLEGGEKELIRQLTTAMQECALNFDYERAAVIRDQIRAVERSLEEQTVVLQKKTDADLLAIRRDATGLTISLLQVRQGVIRDLFNHYQGAVWDSETDLLCQFMRQWYYHHEAPKIICTSLPPSWQEEIAAELSERYQRKVNISQPQRGIFAKLLQKAEENAAQTLLSASDRPAAYEEIACQIAQTLKMARIPHFIECIDISQLQGTNVVGVTVAFTDGLPDKANYRRYRIQGATDDFAAVYEVVRRRMEPGGNNLPDHLPDLLVIDGGRGQLSAAQAALDDSGTSGKVALVAMAKARTAPTAFRANNPARQHERLFLPGRKNPIILKEGSACERLFVQLRDATHHSAITYHRQLRAKNAKKSLLDNISGLGPARRRAILAKFGSVNNLATATVAELCTIPGITPNLAATIISVVNSGQKS